MNPSGRIFLAAVAVIAAFSTPGHAENFDRAVRIDEVRRAELAFAATVVEDRPRVGDLEDRSEPVGSAGPRGHAARRPARRDRRRGRPGPADRGAGYPHLGRGRLAGRQADALGQLALFGVTRDDHLRGFESGFLGVEAQFSFLLLGAVA